MKKTDAILAIIIGFITGAFFFFILEQMKEEVSNPMLLQLIANSWLFIVILPILAFLGMFIASWIGKKLLIVYQAAKFFLVGILNTIIDIGVLNILIALLNVATGFLYAVFKGISFLVATTNSYFWNKFWTFEKRQETAKPGEFLKFLIVTTVGLLINVGVASVVVNVIGPQLGITVKLWASIGAIVAAFFAFVWNFLASKFVVFRK